MAAKRLPDGRIPVLLSAHAEELVACDAHAIAEYVDRFPATTVSQVAGQLRRTRRVRRYRAVLRAADRAELIDALLALAEGRAHPLVTRSAKSSRGSAPRQAFVFPGQGGQWPGMGSVAYQQLPGYRAAIDECAAAFDAAGTVSPLRYLTSEDMTDDLPAFSEIEIEGAQFVHAVGLARVWISCGVLPDLTVGHSLGEVAAAYVAGSITLPEAVAVVAARAGVVDRLPGRYAVAALGVSERDARPLIAATDGFLELSVVNAPSTVAVSGDRDAVSAIVETVRGGGGFAREITVGFPVHTSVLEPLRGEFMMRLPASEFADAPVLFIGGTTGDVVMPGTEFHDYWFANLRQMVRFDRAVESAIRCGAASFIELSANPTLLFAMDQIFEADLPDGPAVLVGSGRRDESLAAALSASIVTAAIADPGFAWGELDPAPADGAGLRGFPNAPMRAIPMWAHPQPLPPVETMSNPRPALTIGHEQWEPAAGPPPVAGPPARIALLDLDGPDVGGPLTRPLRVAIESHPVATLSEPADAEVVVAIAPALEGSAGLGGSASSDAERAARDLVRRIGDGLFGYADVAGVRCRTFCLVTVGAEHAVGHDAVPCVVDAGQAALAAMHRSIGFDYPEITFTHVDLPSWELTPDAGSAAVDAVLSGSIEQTLESALRSTATGPETGYVRFERTLRDAPAAPQLALDSGLLDDVVITGGAGAIGLHYARRLAAHGARRIVLLSRRPADAELLQSLATQYGTELASPACDITDPAQVSSIAAEYGGTGASLIIHAAGSATLGAGLPDASGIQAADTFAAKVSGLARMIELWPARPGARMLLCSSVSGVWGGRGHAAYSAANRLLDVMAGQLRAQGRHCAAVKWGLWQGADGSGIVDATEIANIQRSGLRPMPPDEAVEASLRDWRTDPLVFAADATRLQIFLDSRKAGAPESPPVVAGDADISIVDAVRGQLAAVLGIEQAAELSLGESLFDLGVDSMLAVDLRKRLKRLIGRTVPLAALLDEITGDELVAKLEAATEQSDEIEHSDEHTDTKQKVHRA
jgi:mycobactin polyketide synthetase MbtD